MIRILSSLILIIASHGILASPITQLANPAAPAPRTAITPAMQLQMGVDSLLSFLQQGPQPAPQSIARFLDSEIAPFFDFDHMARSASGRYYYQFSPQQRTAMADEMKRVFLSRLTLRLTSYHNQQVRYLPARLSPNGKEAMVSMLIKNPGNYPSRIDFRLLRSPNGWSVIDVAANGQSAIVFYRQEMLRKMSGYRRW